MMLLASADSTRHLYLRLRVFSYAPRSPDCSSLPVAPLGLLLGAPFPAAVPSQNALARAPRIRQRRAGVLKGRPRRWPRRCCFRERQAVFTTDGARGLYYQQSDSKSVFSDPFNKRLSQPGQRDHFFLPQMLYNKKFRAHEAVCLAVKASH